MNLLTSTVARWIFCIPLMVFGINHLMGADQMAGLVPTWLPGGVVWVYVTGVFLIAGGLAMALRKMDRTASLLMALYMLVLILIIHLPGAMSDDPMMKMMGMTNLLKDMAIMGGCLTFAGLAGKA